MLPYLYFSPHHGSGKRRAYFTTQTPNRLDRLYHQPAHAILLCQRFAHKGGTGISTSYPSPTTVVLGLGPDLPWADEPSPGNLGLSTCRFLACISLLIPAFSLLCSPPLLRLRLLPAHYAPLPLEFMNTTSCVLSPENIWRISFHPAWKFANCSSLPHEFSVHEPEPEASVVCFSPVTSSAHNHSTSELLRTL